MIIFQILLIPTYPDGLDIELFSFNALNKTFLKVKLKYKRNMLHLNVSIRKI